MTDGAQRPGKPGSVGGDFDAFDQLFRREFVPIARAAYLVVGDWEVAREIAQDGFMHALRHWTKVQGLESPGGWVRRVAIRDAVRTRRRTDRGRTLGSEPPPAANEPAVALDIRSALLTLPRRQRAVIALHYLDDRPIAEIAALLGCTRGTVKTHLSRGRQALAVLLGEDLTDELR